MTRTADTTGKAGKKAEKYESLKLMQEIEKATGPALVPYSRLDGAAPSPSCTSQFPSRSAR